MLSSLKGMKVCAFALLAVLAGAAQAEPVVVKSPGGELEISIATVKNGSVSDEGGQLAYRVSFRGKPVLNGRSLD
jgi:diaminopimelate epimerase